MVRRKLIWGLVLSSMLATVGCENWRGAIRSSDDSKHSTSSSKTVDASGLGTDPTKFQAVDSDAKNPQPFFKNNRRSGGWSSEAREIESHLGVD